jgi:DNA-binding transcriptional ArsR family regulator
MRKTYNQIERIIKGFANHRRIEILELLKKQPELSVIEISEKININFKTASEHIRKLTIAGLIIKRWAGHAVRHKLTSRGEQVLKFCRTLE